MFNKCLLNKPINFAFQIYPEIFFKRLKGFPSPPNGEEWHEGDVKGYDTLLWCCVAPIPLQWRPRPTYWECCQCTAPAGSVSWGLLSCDELPQQVHTVPSEAHGSWLIEVGLHRPGLFSPMWDSSDGPCQLPFEKLSRILYLISLSF